MKARARFASILLLFLTGWQAAAADYYVAPERTGTGDGKSAANAAAWCDQQAYIHAPTCRQAITQSGMFSTSTVMPTGQRVKWLRIMAMPVTPPETMSLGNMKYWKPIA